MSFEFILRLIGMVVSRSWYLSWRLSQPGQRRAGRYICSAFGVGGSIGWVDPDPFHHHPTGARLTRSTGPRNRTDPGGRLDGSDRGTGHRWLLALPLSLLPEPFRSILPFLGVLLFAYFGLLCSSCVRVISSLSCVLTFLVAWPLPMNRAQARLEPQHPSDTSVIIDGDRDIARTGFLAGRC